MVETEKKGLEGGYETEDEEDMTSGKQDKMDEAEDTLGRFEYEIEESVADFEDEIPTERNEIPESSDDSSEDEIDVREKRMKRRRSDDKLALGTNYYTLYEFKEVVLEYALSKRRNIKQDRWDKTKVSYVCGIGGKCKWRIYCSYDIESQKWVLKTKYRYHSCTPDGKCKLLKSPVIARLFLDKLRQKADLMPEEIQQIIKEKWKIVSTRNQCQRGRLLALKWLEKEYEEHEGVCSKYVAKLLAEEKKIADECVTTPATRGVFEVSVDNDRHKVNTIRHTCSCGKWQISGVPCEHAYGAMIDKGLNVDEYVSNFFSTMMWQYIYNTNLEPVRGPRVWMKSGLGLIVAPPEPEQPGRKKKKKQKKFPRIKGKFESPKKKKKREVEKLGRAGRTVHCGSCGEAGHNANGCKVHPKKKVKKTHQTVEEGTSSHVHEEIRLTQPTQCTQAQD